ncbi:MAG: hypothetical protein IAE80_19430 [Anaerolinea sp.]|nr:hypothetical protein [Anaerolinea sp.]
MNTWSTLFVKLFGEWLLFVYEVRPPERVFIVIAILFAGGLLLRPPRIVPVVSVIRMPFARPIRLFLLGILAVIAFVVITGGNWGR